LNLVKLESDHMLYESVGVNVAEPVTYCISGSSSRLVRQYAVKSKLP